MAQLLKDKYNYQSIQALALKISTGYSLFKVDEFINDIIDKTWDKSGLKARMRKIAISLGRYLPTDYEQALGIIDKIIADYPVGFNDFTLMYFADFIEIYGQNEDNWALSMAALESYTKYSSAEFAVRRFIINNEKRMMAQMLAWSKHDNVHVRRLASEGCRPQLPWGQTLTSFKKNPIPILCILEQLKADPELYVRKSVANNLNDISKTHPNLVIKIAREWYGKNNATNWIIKHGCRTLLKKGNKAVLEIFGFKNVDYVHVTGFSLSSNYIFIGDKISFSFMIESKKAVKLRLEYAIYYVKANGKRNRKIFQISEISLNVNIKKTYIKKHSFADISTRKHYAGIHSVSLIINGIEREAFDFTILTPKIALKEKTKVK